MVVRRGLVLSMRGFLKAVGFLKKKIEEGLVNLLPQRSGDI